MAIGADGLLTRAGELTVTRDLVSGRIVGTAMGSVTTSTSYNAFGELESLESASGGNPLYLMALQRDRLGRIETKTETIAGVTQDYGYSYDVAGRLVRVERNGTRVEEYRYDDNGNRLSAAYPWGELTATYDERDRLLTYGDTTFTYSPADELTSRTEAGGTTVYDYDVFGNLRRVELPGGDTIEFIIDGRNRRLGRRENGILLKGLLYQDALNPVAELDSSGAMVARFVYGARANVPAYMVKAGGAYRLISDHLGSVRLVVDVETGAIAQHIDYDAFGRTVLDTNPGFQPFGFAGGLHDPVTGLVRFGRRDYDPQEGRWTTRDPILFEGGSLNLYGYVFNDPVNLIDAWGLKCVNKTNSPVVVKPESVDDPIFELPPGETYDGPIDGVKPPAWDGDWYKVSDGTDVTIKPDGTPSSSGGPWWVPEVLDLGAPTDSFPGRKDEPDWSERHPDWKYPPDDPETGIPDPGSGCAC